MLQDISMIRVKNYIIFESYQVSNITVIMCKSVTVSVYKRQNFTNGTCILFLIYNILLLLLLLC